MAKHPTDAQRTKVFARAKGVFEYCRHPEKYSNPTFEVEHIIPFSRGGKTVLAKRIWRVRDVINLSRIGSKRLMQKRVKRLRFITRAKTFGASILPGTKIL